MSKIEGPVPTAGGDAPVVETTKADRVNDSSSQSTSSVEPTQVDVAPENVASSAAESHATSTEVKAEVNTSAEGVVDSGTKTANANAEDLKEGLKNATATDCQTTVAQPHDEKKARAARFERNRITRRLSSQIVMQPIYLLSQIDDNSKPNVAQAKGDNAVSVSQLEEEVRVRKSSEDGECLWRNDSPRGLADPVKSHV